MWLLFLSISSIASSTVIGFFRPKLTLNTRGPAGTAARFLTALCAAAPRGVYRLDGEQANTSGEASDGFIKLLRARQDDWPEPLRDYLDVVASFNANGAWQTYPGSPFILARLMLAPDRHAARDRLKLFEMHPTDQKLLRQNIEALGKTRDVSTRSVQMQMGDGFEALKALLPPPVSGAGSRRAGKR